MRKSVNVSIDTLDEPVGIFETPKNQRFRQMRQKMVIDKVYKRSEQLLNSQLEN